MTWCRISKAKNSVRKTLFYNCIILLKEETFELNNRREGFIKIKTYLMIIMYKVFNKAVLTL